MVDPFMMLIQADRLNHQVLDSELEQLAVQAVTKRTRFIATVDLLGQGQLGFDPDPEFGGREFLRRLGRAVVHNPHHDNALGVNVQAQLEGLGLDIHAESIVVVRIVDHSAPQPAQKFTPAKFRVWVKTQLALAQQVHSCYEAGPFGYGLHRELLQLGVQNLVVQPVCLDEHHKGVNHDKSDAKELALRLDRYVAGNTHAVATVRVPTPEEEQKRIQSRQREQLRREVQRLAAQGRGLLLTPGYRETR